MLVGCELERKRDYGLGLLLERPLQEGMARLAQLQRALLRDHWHPGDEVERGLSLRHYEVNLAEESRSLDELRHVRPEELAEIVEYAGYLTSLVETQGADLVLHADDLHRFYEHGLARSGLVVDEALDFAFGGRRHRDQELSVAHVQGGVRLHQALFLGLAKDRGGPAGNGGLGLPEFLADLVKLFRSGVLHLAVAVDDGVYPLLHVAERADLKGHLLEIGIDPVLHAGEELRDPGDRADHGAELPRGQQVDAVPVLQQRLQERQGVDVAGSGERLLEHHYQAHLVGQKQAMADAARVGGKLLRGHAVSRVVGAAPVRNDLPDAVEAELLFQPCIYRHC